MELRFIMRDGERILQQGKTYRYMGEEKDYPDFIKFKTYWQDVPLVEESEDNGI